MEVFVSLYERGSQLVDALLAVFTCVFLTFLRLPICVFLTFSRLPNP